MRLMLLLLKSDEGQGLVEYSLILALLAIVAIASLSFLGKKASDTLRNAAVHLGPTPGPQTI